MPDNIHCSIRMWKSRNTSKSAPRTALQAIYRIRTVVKWSSSLELTRNNPFDQYQITQPMYGDPFYLTLEERDRVYYADLSGLGATHPVYRDIFMFQCLISCRVNAPEQTDRSQCRGRMCGIYSEDQNGTRQYSQSSAR